MYLLFPIISAFRQFCPDVTFLHTEAHNIFCTVAKDRRGRGERHGDRETNER